VSAAPPPVEFAIVTPVFNGAGLLDEAILSILGQAGDFRIRYHVQDGGSTDGTLAKLAAWRDRLAGRFPILCRAIDFTFASGPDGGLYDALARGFAATGHGQVMTWLNADDRLEPGALQSVARILERFPDIHWLSGRSTIADETGLILISWPIVAFPRKAIAAGLFDGRHAPPFIQQEGTFWRASLWEAVGGIDPRFRLAGDFDLWRRFAAHADLVIVDSVLGCWRRRGGQLSADKAAYHAEIDGSLDAAAQAARAGTAAAYRDAAAAGELRERGFGYRILHRPDMGDWALAQMPAPATDGGASPAAGQLWPRLKAALGRGRPRTPAGR